ncbi:MAG TPA: hypothetical protein VN859_04045, partial [Steroidobacteraceae bacterium]|nr:hypothetical protein [Steroidobacteraceae bacterium]
RLCIAALLAGTSLGAHALGRLADVSIIDSATGAVLTPHYYQGEYWIAGAPGVRYSIEIRNRLSERMLAVTAVDGVNVISGDTANWEQTGYVFGAGEGYRIDGWRKSDAEVAAFEFTAAPASYAARTGRPANLGVIGVALFRERIAPPVLAYETAPGPVPMAQAPAAAGAAAAGATAAAPESVPSATRSMDFAARPERLQKLGTGHGQREFSYVAHTEFERQQPAPNEVIRIRYDSLANLIAMGVLPQPRTWPAPNPFPDAPLAHYAPDPPG